MQKPPTDVFGKVIEQGDYVLFQNDSCFMLGLVLRIVPKDKRQKWGRWRGELRVTHPYPDWKYDYVAKEGDHVTKWQQDGKWAESCVRTELKEIAAPFFSVGTRIAVDGKQSSNFDLIIAEMEKKKKEITSK